MERERNNAAERRDQWQSHAETLRARVEAQEGGCDANGAYDCLRDAGHEYIKRVAPQEVRDHRNEHREEAILRVGKAAQPLLDKCDGTGDRNLTYTERMELRTALRELIARIPK